MQVSNSNLVSLRRVDESQYKIKIKDKSSNRSVSFLININNLKDGNISTVLNDISMLFNKFANSIVFDSDGPKLLEGNDLMDLYNGKSINCKKFKIKYSGLNLKKITKKKINNALLVSNAPFLARIPINDERWVFDITVSDKIKGQQPLCKLDMQARCPFNLQDEKRKKSPPFGDAFTLLATRANQLYREDFNQAKKGVEKLTIRTPVDGNHLELSYEEGASSNFMDNSKTVTDYYNFLNFTYGANKVRYIEYQFGLDFLKMQENNLPLRPEHIYKMNIGLGTIEIQDIEEMVGSLDKILKLEANLNLRQACGKVAWPAMPAYQIEKLLNAIEGQKYDKENITVADLRDWLNQRELLANAHEMKKFSAMSPAQFQHCVNIVEFDAGERAAHYTGMKISGAMKSGYTKADATTFKPWVDQQQLSQQCERIRKSKAVDKEKYFAEVLAHVICKQLLVHPHPKEGYRVGMMLPLYPFADGIQHWYIVTSCINNTFGNVSYTLEPACHDPSLPAIKLFRSTASDKYTWDGQASIFSDANPINPPGYLAQRLLEDIQKAFFKERTIPIWVGYLSKAEELLTREPTDLKQLEMLLRNSTESLLEENPAIKAKPRNLPQLVSRYDDVLIALLQVIKTSHSRTFLHPDYILCENLLKKYSSHIAAVSLEEQLADAMSLKILCETYYNKSNNSLNGLIDFVTELENNLIKNKISEIEEYNIADFKNKINDIEIYYKKEIHNIDSLKIWISLLKARALIENEYPSQKIAQSINIDGHSLGGALAQLCTAEILNAKRIPLPGYKIKLFAFDGPGIREDDNAHFLKQGLRHKELVKDCFQVHLYFETKDFIGLGGENHLGSSHSDAAAWLQPIIAILTPKEDAQAKGIKGTSLSHETRFFEGKEGRDYTVQKLTPQELFKMEQSPIHKSDSTSAAAFDVTPVFSWISPERFRKGAARFALATGALNFAADKKDDPLYGEWRKNLQNGVFVVKLKPNLPS